ncbi:hypothetical protein NC653_004253 [Populus alba x Populus x berolinensis]|uniref:Uncharacterized protein n=1 Tax=Populus alba x Populus x berolinensis TaxID=444605 RepID=A0AAD6RTJ3_9ROSI|nr:hypothetical protein NC653_004253 [Populus alba x Populus x berolinensis]
MLIVKLLYVAIAVGLSAFVGEFSISKSNELLSEGLCWTRTAERQSFIMRMEYLKSVLRQQVGFFDTQEAGSSTTHQVVSTISNDANSIQVAICDKIPNCLAYMSTFVFCLVTSYMLSWKLALAALPLTLMFIIPGLVFGKFMVDVIMKMVESYEVAGGIAEQAVSSIRTAWLGTYLVTEKGGSIFVAGINIIIGGLSVLGALPNLTSITEAMAASTRIFQMIDRTPSIDSDDKKGKALSFIRGEIQFQDIYFNYPSRLDTPILQGLNLTIPAGKTVGLVGGSGSGKSTVISLLQRFYDPDEGQILLDGHKVNMLQLKWWRSQMGLVNQEPVLFATSIKENILFGKEGASMDDVVNAAKDANAHDFITKLQDGYETQVGQFGFQLSGGQKQRIAIARALIRDPKILLLDEATSVLDVKSKGIVQDAIDEASKGRTTINIAHRLSTIRTANLIVVLQAGRVIESGIAALDFITSLLQHYNFTVMGEKLTTRVREKLLAKLMTFEIGWFDDDENTSASICAKLATEANMFRSLVGDPMSLLVQAFFGSLFAYILGLILTWRLALVMIVQPLVVGSYYSKSVLMKSMAGKAQKAHKEGSFGLFSSQFLNTASTALSFWYGGRLLTEGLISPEHLFQAFLILLFFAYVIAEAGSMTNDLSKGGNAIRSVLAILDRKSEIDPSNSWGALDIKKKLKGQVEFNNVFFAYPTRPDQMIFKGLNLKIDAGKTMALVGPSGYGKSTVIGLIERFYDPMKGTVFIDGQDVKSYKLRLLRSHIALVSQEPTLFAGTIRENIAYGKEDARESEIRKATVLANAHEFISVMKDGYDTYCGERGVQLSGGQKQRIALARAIIKDPSILLLDEATSALDSVSESLVQDALEKMMVVRTCVVIAHRLSTIQKSNCISVIKNGKVVEQGSHTELMELGNGGAYYSLTRIQSGSSSYH